MEEEIKKLKERIKYVKNQITIVKRQTKELKESHEKWKKTFIFEQNQKTILDLLPIIDLLENCEKNMDQFPEEAEKALEKFLPIEVEKFKKKYEIK